MMDFVGTLDDFMGDLAPFEKQLISNMLSSGIAEDRIIELWLDRASSGNVALHGVLGGRSSLLSKFKYELYLLVCTQDAKYKDVRENLVKHSGTVGGSSVVAIGTALSSYIGISAALLTPAVAVAGYAIAKMGRNAWCAQIKGSS